MIVNVGQNNFIDPHSVHAVHSLNGCPENGSVIYLGLAGQRNWTMLEIEKVPPWEVAKIINKAKEE